MPSLTLTHGGQRQLVHIAATGYLLLAADHAVLGRDALDPGHAGQAERVGHANRHLIVAGVRGLVAEEDQVVLVLIGADRLDDCRRRRLADPTPSRR